MSKIKADTYLGLINDIKYSQLVRKENYIEGDVVISPEGVLLNNGVILDWKIKLPQNHKYKQILNEAISARVHVGIPQLDENNCTYEFNAIDLIEHCASEVAHKLHKVGYHIAFWAGMVIASIIFLGIKFFV